MKKDEWIAYLLIWTVLLGLSVLFFCTVGFGLLVQNEKNEKTVSVEDDFLSEQLLQENEDQMIKMVEQEAESAKASEYTDSPENIGNTESETKAVFSDAVNEIQTAGNLLSSYFIVDPNTTLLESDVPLDILMNMDVRVDRDRSEPQILIYHTHATEGYVDSIDGDVSTTVVGVGDYLHELLTTRYGYHVLHITDSFDLAEGYLDRSRAYNHAREGIQKVLEQYPSIEVVIDVHRDGVAEDRHLLTQVNGKPTAQIMFFNGLSRTNEDGELESLPNQYIQENLAFSLQLEVLGNHYYPDYVRGVYVKGYRYNLHFRPKSLLLEVGAQTNTLQEALNAMEPFAEILDKLLKGA